MPGATSAIASAAAKLGKAERNASNSAVTPSDAARARKRLFRGAERRRLRCLSRILLTADAAIDERRRRFLGRRDRGDEIAALDGAVADRIRRRRAAGQREGLAAAAAPV